MFLGSLVALVTPMHRDGSIDYPSFERLIDWHLENDTDGLVVLGTTGESPTINSTERQQLIRLAVQRAHPKIPVIVGTGSNSTEHTIELTREAKALGADAVLLVTPYYNKPTQEGLYQHFKAIAESVNIPQILYNVPSRTGCDLLPATIVRLAKIPNIVAVKEATGDVSRVSQILTNGVDIALLTGDDATAMEFMLAGGKGVISVVANVAPKLFHELCVESISGNREMAARYHEKLLPLAKKLFIESNPIPVKWALTEMHRISNGIRLPLTPLSESHHAEVREALKHAEITLEN